MVLRLRQHNIGYTADGFCRSDDPTNRTEDDNIYQRSEALIGVLEVLGLGSLSQGAGNTSM